MRRTRHFGFVEVFNCLTVLESNVSGNDCTYSIENAIKKAAPSSPSDVLAPLVMGLFLER